MEIVYFSRNPKSGFSIAKVFTPIIKEMSSNHINTVHSYEMPNIGASLMSIIKNIIYVFKHRSKKGVNHITGDITYCAIALAFSKVIITIHDTYYLDQASSTLKEKCRNYLYVLFWIVIPVLLSNKTTCISDESTNRLKTHLPKWLHKKILIIHNPVDQCFKYSLRKERPKLPIVLHIGTKENKNIERTIQSLKDLDCILHIIGRLSEKQIEVLKSSSIRYKNSYNLTDAEMVAAYNESYIIAFVSLYEGFGMPIIEGQAVGRAVVTSNIPPMSIISGGGALLVNPTNVDDIKAGFRLLLENEETYNDVVRNGCDNVSKFSIEFITKQYYALYNII